ncbi:hypothetical protein Acsp03_07590 [Actinomadura sp. NBRC 104412]|nr:hypothetical protein Acsp03_07590 [Actinomadura sp. NBRC 104412]
MAARPRRAGGAGAGEGAGQAAGAGSGVEWCSARNTELLMWNQTPPDGPAQFPVGLLVKWSGTPYGKPFSGPGSPTGLGSRGLSGAWCPGRC